ncbi:hypothetical protein MFUR16E_04480 [Methylobacterium fujisawaense]|uniref:hypothetical protein n=1 Tax=Methylobacterium fujisawaense TaxID=107400 RepID=UPI002F2FF760
MRVTARIQQPFGTLHIDGEQPFLVVSANQRTPLAGPWIVVDADGANAVRHDDQLRAVFDVRDAPVALAAQLNRARAA